jgi:D-psicose/D-tagatose/L-ribulose 3-epimerase
MQGFGVHTSMWTMAWDREGCERAVARAASYGMDFLEIALLNPAAVDAAHSRATLEAQGMRAVCSLGLPAGVWASRNPEGAIDFLKVALDKTAAIGAEALSGVIYGGIGERSGLPPTETELDNVARAMTAAAAHARTLGLSLGIEPVNRYETHLLNTGWQAVAMVERIGAENIFVHLDTYHMNIEEKGIAQGIYATSTSPNPTVVHPAPAPSPGTKSSRRCAPSASAEVSRWKASSTCRPRSPMASRSGARWRAARPR